MSVAVPAAQGGREQAQLALMLDQQKDRLAQLQAMQTTLQTELQAAGMRTTCKTEFNGPGP